jgi:hypothetical protein
MYGRLITGGPYLTRRQAWPTNLRLGRFVVTDGSVRFGQYAVLRLDSLSCLKSTRICLEVAAYSTWPWRCTADDDLALSQQAGRHSAEDPAHEG